MLASAPGSLEAGGRAATRTATPRRPAALAGVLTEQAKLTGIGDARGDSGEDFGDAVAVDGDTAVVGAPGHDLPARDTGAAYVFVRTAGVWTLEAKLSPVGPPAVTRFGVSVAVSGDTVVVGAGSFSSSGAYVFVRSGGVWTQEARLIGSDTQTSDRFGAAVSVSGDTVVVGAPSDTTGFGFQSGSAHVFVRSGGVWAEQQKLLPADLAADDLFGQSVSVSGDSLVAGSPGDDTGFGIDAGSAYVFVRSGAVWAQETKLTAPGGAAWNGFGSSVSMHLDAAAVGAPAESAGPSGAGAVHIFERAGGLWSEEQRIVAPVSTQGFGAAVALDTDTLVVGTPDEYAQAFDAGAAYVFVRSGGVWAEEQRLAPSVPEAYAEFGRSVAVSGETTLAGAPGRDDGSGSAFVFLDTGPTWTEEARLDPPGTTSLDGFGSAVALEGDVLAVGAPSDDTPGGRGAGSVYVFVRAGASWTLQQKIVAADSSDRDRFGAAVALSGDTLAVGAPEVAGVSYESGAVYLFVRNGGVWQQQQKLAAPAGGSLDNFGSAVSLDGDSLIVGAPGEEEGDAYYAGAAYVFVRTGISWSLAQRLVSSPPTDFGRAGSAVALEADRAIVGVPGEREALVFLHTAGGWIGEATLSASDGSPAYGFGRTLGLSGDTAIVGWPGAEVQGAINAGAAYVFVRNGGTWTQQQKLVDTKPSFYGQFGAAVAIFGDTALAAPDPYASGFQAGYALLFERTGGTWTGRPRIAAFDGAADDRFGSAVALSGVTAAVGAPGASTPTGVDSGAVYVLVPATADLALGITGSPGSVVQGDLVTYTIVVTNNGPDAAPAVGVATSLDPGLVVESASASQGGCTPAASSVTCDVGVLPAGASASVTVVAVGVNVGVSTSQASILWAGSDPVPGNDSASTSTTVDAGGPADVSITKSGPPYPAAVGSNLYYQIQVANLGPSTAAGVEVLDPTPPGLTMLGTSGVCTNGFPCTIPRIPAGESRTISATFAIPASYPGPDPVVNTATVTTATPDPVPSNDTSTVVTPFFVPGGNHDFYTLTPCRLLDTRSGSDPFAAGSVELVFPAFGPCGVPYGARAVAVNVTVTQASASGNLRLYPAGMPVPLVSTINYGAGQTRGNNAVVSLSSYGGLAVKVGQASGTVHVIIDVFGYFE